MKLYEHEGKSLLRAMEVPIPRGDVASDLKTAQKIAAGLTYPVVVKSQLLRGGRGKAGGIQFAPNQSELSDCVNQLLGMQIGEETVRQLLIEEQLSVVQEYYMGITVDPETGMPMLMLSPEGGMEIESIARQSPETIVRQHLDPLQTYRPFHTLNLGLKAGLEEDILVRVSQVLLNLIHCYFKFEAITAEINPFILDDQGQTYAADAKFEIDDAALFRLPEIKSFPRPEVVGNPLEEEARIAGVSYVRLKDEGNIGLIAGGAGVGMATMDAVYHHGGVPANFLDLGHATPAKTAAALKIVLKTPGVEGVFINAFGGINNCEQMAQGIVSVIEELNPPQVITVKMRGHSQDAGWSLLEDRGIPIVKYGTTEEGIVLLLEEMRKKK